MLPEGVPYARGADADRPPDAYLVCLDGIGKRRVRDTRDGGQLVKAVLAGAPGRRSYGCWGRCSPTHTADTVITLIRARHGATTAPAAGDHPAP